MLLHSPDFDVKKLSKSAKDFDQIRNELNRLSIKQKNVMLVNRVKTPESTSHAPEVLQQASQQQQQQASQQQQRSQTGPMEVDNENQSPVPQLQIPYFSITDALKLFLQDPEIRFFFSFFFHATPPIPVFPFKLSSVS